MDQPRCHALIKISDASIHVFTEKQPDFLKYWMKILELPEYQENFEVDSIHYDSDLQSFVTEANPSVIYINGEGVNSYSGKSPLCPSFDWFSQFFVNRGALYNIINEVKLKKSTEEVELMKNSAAIGCNAHVFVLKNIKPGMTEAHVQTLFRVSYKRIHLTSSSNQDSMTTRPSARILKFAPPEKMVRYSIITPTTRS